MIKSCFIAASALFLLSFLSPAALTAGDIAHELPSELDKFFDGLSHLETRDVGSEAWTDLTVGVMMQQDAAEQLSAPAADRHAKRSPADTASRETSQVFVKRDPSTGKLALPRSFQEASMMAKRANHHIRRGTQNLRRRMSVVITWYTGHDLLNPSCVQDSSWSPTDASFVGAVTIEWAGKPACGRFVKIRHQSDQKKSVVVRIVDSCGGCASGTAHIDLSKAAFQKLYNIDVGLVSGLQATVVDPPSHLKWTEKDVARYGPKKL